MTAPTVSRADLQRVHAAMHITVPLDQASPMLLKTLAVVAHCWLKKHGRALPRAEQEQTQQQARRREMKRSLPDLQHAIDLKRRAAGDVD